MFPYVIHARYEGDDIAEKKQTSLYETKKLIRDPIL